MSEEVTLSLLADMEDDGLSDRSDDEDSSLSDGGRQQRSGSIQLKTMSSPANCEFPQNWQASKTSVQSRVATLLLREHLADVHFIVGREESKARFPGHRLVLSVASAVFDAMFNGAMASSQGEILVPDVEPDAFQSLLKYIYTDEIAEEFMDSLKICGVKPNEVLRLAEIDIGPETVMSTLYAAKKYSVPYLEQQCVEYLKSNLNSDNAFMLLTQARFFDEPQLAAMCLALIDKKTREALASPTFLEIDAETLCAVLDRDTLGLSELRLYDAALLWARSECTRRKLDTSPSNLRLMLDRALYKIRFPLMSLDEFAAGPAQSGILTDSQCVQLFIQLTQTAKESAQLSGGPPASHGPVQWASSSSVVSPPPDPPNQHQTAAVPQNSLRNRPSSSHAASAAAAAGSACSNADGEASLPARRNSNDGGGSINGRPSSPPVRPDVAAALQSSGGASGAGASAAAALSSMAVSLSSGHCRSSHGCASPRGQSPETSFSIARRRNIPRSEFPDAPRCLLTGQEQVVSRFYQVESRWGYSGTSDRVRFLVNRKIFVVGFGLYGSIHGHSEYQVKIEVLRADTFRVLGQNDTCFVCDGSENTFRVCFKEPVEIEADVHHIASATLKGPDSFYGTKGLRKIQHESPEATVSFSFTYAAGQNNGTSVEDGQIPELIFFT